MSTKNFTDPRSTKIINTTSNRYFLYKDKNGALKHYAYRLKAKVNNKLWGIPDLNPNPDSNPNCMIRSTTSFGPFIPKFSQ